MFIYLTTNLIKKEKYLKTRDPKWLPYQYIGSKTFEDDKYMGSSKTVRADVDLYGFSAFKREYLFQSIVDNYTKNELIVVENDIQKAFDVVNDSTFYNQTLAFELNFTTAGTTWYYNPANPNEKTSCELHKEPKGWILGFKPEDWNYYNNGITSLLYKQGNEPIGWVLGKHYSATGGRKWYHNPKDHKNRGLYEFSDIPVGWVEGSGHTDKFWVYNKTEPSNRSMINSIDDLPTGWCIGTGAARNKLVWYHCDTTRELKKFNPQRDVIPSGWVKGKICYTLTEQELLDRFAEQRGYIDHNALTHHILERYAEEPNFSYVDRHTPNVGKSYICKIIKKT